MVDSQNRLTKYAFFSDGDTTDSPHHCDIFPIYQSTVTTHFDKFFQVRNFFTSQP